MAITVFIVVPVLIYGFGDFPRRTIIKELISLITILSFFIMLMQFYLSRANNVILNGHKMRKTIKWHKVLGYVFVSILIIHPIMVILLRYFEPGVTLEVAFQELISNFDKQGLLLGLIAWSTMLIIGITSYFRDKIPLKYITWRYIHGFLSIVFIAAASLHVIDMGRHISQSMVGFISILAIFGIAMLLKTYVFRVPQNSINHG